MALKFGTATRRKAKLRLGIMGPSGSGKSWGALEIAGGLVPWEKVFVVDTERGSASLYANKGAYQVCELTNDFSPMVYTQAIKEAEQAGAECIILDSLSHAWEGLGGALDMMEAAQAKSKSGNSFTAWKEVTPAHRALVDAILQSSAHIIVTLRVKTEYVIEKDERGKSTPRKVGMAPIQRAGLEYEFTTFFDVDETHKAVTSKDRTAIFDGKQVSLSREVGERFKAWLDSGAEPLPQAPAGPIAKAGVTEAMLAALTPNSTADAAFDAVEIHKAALMQAASLDDLVIAWKAIPAGYQPALLALKNEQKLKLQEVK